MYRLLHLLLALAWTHAYAAATSATTTTDTTTDTLTTTTTTTATSASNSASTGQGDRDILFLLASVAASHSDQGRWESTCSQNCPDNDHDFLVCMLYAVTGGGDIYSLFDDDDDWSTTDFLEAFMDWQGICNYKHADNEKEFLLCVASDDKKKQFDDDYFYNDDYFFDQMYNDDFNLYFTIFESQKICGSLYEKSDEHYFTCVGDLVSDAISEDWADSGAVEGESDADKKLLPATVWEAIICFDLYPDPTQYTLYDNCLIEWEYGYEYGYAYDYGYNNNYLDDDFYERFDDKPVDVLEDKDDGGAINHLRG
jgi:hypothetical protein